MNLYRFGTILFIFLWSVAFIDLTKTKLFSRTCLDRDRSFHDLSNDHYLGLLDRQARNRSLHNWFPELLWSFVEILTRLVFHLDPIDSCSHIVSLVALPLSLWFKFSFSVDAFRSVDTAILVSIWISENLAWIIRYLSWRKVMNLLPFLTGVLILQYRTLNFFSYSLLPSRSFILAGDLLTNSNQPFKHQNKNCPYWLVW